ncbi:hypothetical protein Aca07nite_31900 [Actinoplanes capillaceus]|uniref:Conjugal transfer protein TraB n=1 Tax=Actinoplanes campanulatus TaxID=113559 RepID=A0ABQ3WI62_9ACTN|nr:hypothetical protein [Actinoplanes capillaceus]GID45915.1 hypothetical protein Aca07nite_31900 [Actinoplanes capillaceus]
MQIIEISDFAVRSAVVRLRRNGSPLCFVVYPMIHMADPAFFAAVSRRLRTADVIVTEGVGGDSGFSLLGRALTLSYSVLRFNRRAGLVRQRIDYQSSNAAIVNPDATATEFGTAWRRAPLQQRMLIWLLLPAVMAVRLFGGTRTIWSRALEVNDLPTTSDEQWVEQYPRLHDALLGDRDEMLLEALYRLHEERHAEQIEVAVVYGAGHVPAIVHGLIRYGYRPRSADWLTVKSLS